MSSASSKRLCGVEKEIGEHLLQAVQKAHASGMSRSRFDSIFMRIRAAVDDPQVRKTRWKYPPIDQSVNPDDYYSQMWLLEATGLNRYTLVRAFDDAGIEPICFGNPPRKHFKKIDVDAWLVRNGASPAQPRFYKASEIAKIFGVQPCTIHDWVEAGRLEVSHLPGGDTGYRYYASALQVARCEGKREAGRKRKKKSCAKE